MTSMVVCIALFRGINVGGHGRLAMRDLVSVLEAQGFSDVATYVQSGNAVFRCPAGELRGSRAAKLGARIGEAIDARHGFRPQVLLLRLETLEAIAAANPFPEAQAEPTTLHVNFLCAPASAPDLQALEALRRPSERYLLTDAALYLHAPDGIVRSKLASALARHVGVPMTQRNWRTVTKLIELGRALDA